jgi:hypothetical protein
MDFVGPDAKSCRRKDFHVCKSIARYPNNLGKRPEKDVKKGNAPTSLVTLSRSKSVCALDRKYKRLRAAFPGLFFPQLLNAKIPKWREARQEIALANFKTANTAAPFLPRLFLHCNRASPPSCDVRHRHE